MKKIFMAAVMAVAALSASAQVNVQLHYDLGRATNPHSEANRPVLTSTVEMFKADKSGSTYFFVDMDYFSDGVGGAYWEISREFTVAKPTDTQAISAHIEFDGGLSSNKYTNYSTRFQQCFLAGPTWSWHNSDFSTTFSLSMMYKQYIKQGDLKGIPSFQLTPVWSHTFAKGLLTFSGFADLWYGYTPRKEQDGSARKGFVFLTEPQLWLNIKSLKGFAVGTEWELSNDFIWPDNGSKRTFYCNPTVAVKYDF